MRRAILKTYPPSNRTIDRGQIGAGFGGGDDPQPLQRVQSTEFFKFYYRFLTRRTLESAQCFTWCPLLRSETASAARAPGKTI
jgi:hypothetical protein